MPTAVINIRSEDRANIASALGPEVRRDLMRTHSEVTSEDGTTVLRIDASDTSAMRAAINSYLECIAVTEKIDRITRDSK